MPYYALLHTATDAYMPADPSTHTPTNRSQNDLTIVELDLVPTGSLLSSSPPKPMAYPVEAPTEPQTSS